MQARSMPYFVLFMLMVTLFGTSTAAKEPRLFILDSKNLVKAKEQLQSNDPAVVPAYNKLIRGADRALTSETLSVIQKESTPPSGDKHDYMSIAPYWWPNPNTPNGLP